MGGDGVSDISAGAGEGVGGMVNGAGLTSGSTARSGASAGGSTVGRRLVLTMSWRRFGGFWKVTDGGLVRWSWVDGSEDRVWKPSLRIRLRR